MKRKIEFFFDFGSPYSYLAQSQLQKLAAETGAEIVYMPTSVIDLMKATGNSPTSLVCLPKKKYVKADLQRWVARYGIGWQFNPHFRNIDLSFLLRAAISAIKLGDAENFVSRVFDGLYVQSLNLGDVEILREFLNKNDLPGDRIVEDMSTTETTEELKARNKTSEAAGLFGVPTFRVGEELFFGNDRLSFVEAAAKVGGAS